MSFDIEHCPACWLLMAAGLGLLFLVWL